MPCRPIEGWIIQNGTGMVDAEKSTSGNRPEVSRATGTKPRVEAQGATGQVQGGSEPQPSDDFLKLPGMVLGGGMPLTFHHQNDDRAHRQDHDGGQDDERRFGSHGFAPASWREFLPSTRSWRMLMAGFLISSRQPRGQRISTRSTRGRLPRP